MLLRKPKYDPSMYSLTGAWNISGRDVKDHHFFDKDLSIALTRFFINENCFMLNDIGCGDGKYVKAFCRAGINAKGYDGNPNTEQISKGYGVVMDFTKPVRIRGCNWAMSLEVGEHIPPQFEQVFLDNLTAGVRNGVVLSWAIEGQGGLGHVNCRNNSYIQQQMENRGFERDVYAEDFLRRHAKLPWFKNTIMVYEKK